eukprot:13934304-Ditylum_brightwellii.AAC.1
MLDVLEEGLLGNYSKLIVGFGKDLVMSEYAATCLRTKSTYLIVALSAALDKYGNKEGVRWEMCCKFAIENLE